MGKRNSYIVILLAHKLGHCVEYNLPLFIGPLREAAATYLKTFITEKLTYHCSDERELGYFSDVIVGMIFDPDLDSRYKNLLTIPLRELIRIDSSKL